MSFIPIASTSHGLDKPERKQTMKTNEMMKVIANVDKVQYVHYVREDGKWRPCDLVFDDEDRNLSGVELRFYGKDGGAISINCDTKEIEFCETWEKGYQKVGGMNPEMASVLRPIYNRLYLDKYAELEKENALIALPKFSIRDLSIEIFN